MIKFFRSIRQKLLSEGRISKYLIYAIGEIILVVAGILIAVSIGEWRERIKDRNEASIFYKNLSNDLNRDKIRLDTLIQRYEKAVSALSTEIQKLQLDSYNQDSLYNGFSSWMLYTSSNQFIPQDAVYTEIISNGKLQIMSNEKIKENMLKLYKLTYPRIALYRDNNASMVLEFSTLEVSDSFRWLEAFNKDGYEGNDINFKIKPVRLHHDWLKDKQSDKYLKFENSLAMRHSVHNSNLGNYKVARSEIEELLNLLSNELTRNQ